MKRFAENWIKSFKVVKQSKIGFGGITSYSFIEFNMGLGPTNTRIYQTGSWNAYGPSFKDMIIKSRTINSTPITLKHVK